MEGKSKFAVILFAVIMLSIALTGCISQQADDTETMQEESNADLKSGEHIVTLASNNDNNWRTELIVRKGEKYGELPVPVRHGYTFMGWYDKELGGDRILKGETVDLEKDTIFYGQWLIKEDYKEHAAGIPILMYHWFYEGEPTYEQSSESNWMPIEEFTEQMSYLHTENYYFPTWEELEMYIDGDFALPKNSIIVTDDDGKKEFFELGIPVIRQFDINITSFVITSKIEKSKIEKYMDENISFASHSDNFHIRGDQGIGIVTTMGTDEIIADLQASKEKVNETRVFCYPFGHTSENLKEALMIEGFSMAVTIRHGYVYPGSDKLMLPRIRMDSGMTVEEFKQLISRQERL